MAGCGCKSDEIGEVAGKVVCEDDEDLNALRIAFLKSCFEASALSSSINCPLLDWSMRFPFHSRPNMCGKLTGLLSKSGQRR